MLGEKLSDGRKISSANFFPAMIYLFFPLCLPELIHPTKGIVGNEEHGREVHNNTLKLVLSFGRKLHLCHIIVSAKNTGQHRTCITYSELPGIRVLFLGSQFAAFF